MNNRPPPSTRGEIAIVCLTGLIFVTYLTSNYFLWKQSKISKQSADAATSAALTAQQTYIAGQKSSGDTLVEMQKQSIAMQKAATASKNAASSTHELVLATQAVNEQAKEALVTQTRPWLGIEGDIQSITTDISPEHISVSFEFTLRKYGQSPAIRVVPIFSFSTASKDWAAAPVQTAACEEAAGQSRAVDTPLYYHSVFFTSIFPGDSGVTTTTGNVDFARPNPNSSIPNIVVGCIVYQGAGGGTLRHTRIMYSVLRDSRSPNQVTGFYLRGTSAD